MPVIEVSTFTDYLITNSDVDLKVFFTNYDEDHFTVTDNSATTKQLVFD